MEACSRTDFAKCWRRLRRGTINGLALACALPTLAFAQADAEGPDASPVDALERFLDGVESLSADFRQEVWTADHRLLETADGTMSLKRPNRFYWHFETPPEMIVVADGRALWTYDVELAQVSVASLDDIAVASPAMLLSGDESLRDAFEVVQTYRLDGRDWVKLAPKTPTSDFSSVLIAFAGGAPEQLELVDGLEQTTRIEFTALAVNAPLDDGLFEFEPPPGADVIGELE